MKTLKDYGLPGDSFDLLLHQERYDDALALCKDHYARIKSRLSIWDRMRIRYRLTFIQVCTWLLRKISEARHA